MRLDGILRKQYFSDMQTREHPIPVDPGTMSKEATAYILGVAASKNITPQEATAIIIEAIAKRRIDISKTPNPKKAV